MEAKVIAGVAIALLVVFGAAAFIGSSVFVSRSEAQDMVDNALARQREELYTEQEVEQTLQDTLEEQRQQHEEQLAALEETNSNLQGQIDQLQTELAEMRETEAEEPVEEEEESGCSHTVDELMIDESVPTETLSDRELECLFDGEVEWDNEDYDAEEVFHLEHFYLGSNYEDMGGEVCMEVQATPGLVYGWVFDPMLNLSRISLDESLEFSFLGEPVEIIEWTGNEVTLLRGTYKMVTEGSSHTVVDNEGNEVTLYFPIITDDSVYAKIGDTGREIEEGEAKYVEGVQVKVDAVLENEAGEEQPDMAIVYLGVDVEETIKDGDEYEEDSPWVYAVDGSNHMFVLGLDEEYDDPEDDEFPALCETGAEICLPNDYLCTTWEGLVEEDEEVIELEYDSGDTYVYAEGNFQFGLEDYDEIYCDGTDWRDEDDGSVINNVVMIGNTDLVFECYDHYGPIEVRVNTTDPSHRIAFKGNPSPIQTLWADGSAVSSSYDEGDYITDYGFVVEDLEDCLEDQECVLHVPEERLESSVAVSAP